MKQVTRLGVTGPLGHAASQAKQFYDFYHPPFIKITPYVWNGFSEFGGCFFLWPPWPPQVILFLGQWVVCCTLLGNNHLKKVID